MPDFERPAGVAALAAAIAVGDWEDLAVAAAAAVLAVLLEWLRNRRKNP